jgi:hypothetical protein
MMKKRNDTRNYGKFHPRFAAGGAVEDIDSDDDAPIQMAANLVPPKGSVEAVRPGKVPGEGGGGGSPGGGGRIDFKSAGAQRGESAGAARKLSDDELTAAKARSSDYQARLAERLRLKALEPKPEAPTSTGERIGFKSLGTAKDGE